MVGWLAHLNIHDGDGGRDDPDHYLIRDAMRWPHVNLIGLVAAMAGVESADLGAMAKSRFGFRIQFQNRIWNRI